MATPNLAIMAEDMSVAEGKLSNHPTPEVL